MPKFKPGDRIVINCSLMGLQGKRGTVMDSLLLPKKLQPFIRGRIAIRVDNYQYGGGPNEDGHTCYPHQIIKINTIKTIINELKSA